MKVIPLAFDSFGARSMATFVETDINIIIDPSVALGPKRYGLPPHKIEIERKKELWEKIKEKGIESDVIIITHYHYDHHNPNEVDFWKDKTFLLKDPKKNINLSQRRRSAYFINQIKDIVEVKIADSRSFEFDNTLITFSSPVPHGTDSKLGFVLEVCIDDGKEKFAFSSDVEGVALDEQLKWLIEFDAEIVFVDGAMTYMLGYKYSFKNLERSIRNLITLIEKSSVKKLILDHHLTRDLEWKKRMSDVINFGIDHGVDVISAAKFAKRVEELLEARRRELYGRD